jgi:hypothetical protein
LVRATSCALPAPLLKLGTSLSSTAKQKQ